MFYRTHFYREPVNTLAKFLRLITRGHGQKPNTSSVIISTEPKSDYQISAPEVMIQFQDPQLRNTPVLFHQLLMDAQQAVAGTPSSDCRLGIEENGFIGFLPTEACVGDLICPFPSSNVVAILRQTAEGDKIVGRAIDFLAASSTKPFGLFGLSIEEDLFRETRYPATLRLDIPTLHLLTRISATPNNLIATALARHQSKVARRNAAIARATTDWEKHRIQRCWEVTDWYEKNAY
jgi:hypothetical protein